MATAAAMVSAMTSSTSRTHLPCNGKREPARVSQKKPMRLSGQYVANA